MASWASTVQRLIAELERQGAVVRTSKGGKYVVRNPGVGRQIVFHTTPSHAAQSRHNVELKLAAAGFTLPRGFKL